jgi:sulfur transfer complex TusBCD TusB component (DsrH family)
MNSILKSIQETMVRREDLDARDLEQPRDDGDDPEE